jgi:hypothetical protein
LEAALAVAHPASETRARLGALHHLGGLHTGKVRGAPSKAYAGGRILRGIPPVGVRRSCGPTSCMQRGAAWSWLDAAKRLRRSGLCQALARLARLAQQNDS